MLTCNSMYGPAVLPKILSILAAAYQFWLLGNKKKIEQYLHNNLTEKLLSLLCYSLYLQKFMIIIAMKSQLANTKPSGKYKNLYQNSSDQTDASYQIFDQVCHHTCN